MRTIPQRKLRNQSGEILRDTEKGESFLITVEGRPVAMLIPYPKRRWVPRAEVMRLLAAASRILISFATSPSSAPSTTSPIHG